MMMTGMTTESKQKWGNRIGALGALTTFLLNGLIAVSILSISAETLGVLNILVVGAAGAVFTLWTGEKAAQSE